MTPDSSSFEDGSVYYPPASNTTDDYTFDNSLTTDSSPNKVKETSTSNVDFNSITETPFTLTPSESKKSKKKETQKDSIKEATPQPPNPPQFRYKQVILVRTDLNLSPGKLAAQVAHASVNAFNSTSPLTRKSWLDEGHRKIVLQVADSDALTHYFTHAKQAGLPVSLVVDFGLTELAPNTPTTVAIGPALNEAIDPLTAQLKLL